MRKVLLSTVAALATVGFAGGAFAQNVGQTTKDGTNFAPLYDNADDDTPAIDEGPEQWVDVDALADTNGEGDCNVCDRLDGIEDITDKAADAGYNFVNVQFRNDASGDIRVNGDDGVLDERNFDVEDDLEISTTAMAGVQANKWQASNSGLGDVRTGQVPNKALNAQFRNVASADIISPDGIAEQLTGTAGSGSARNVTISTNAMAGVQANVIEAGNAALND
jgi:hypothetical protein